MHARSKIHGILDIDCPRANERLSLEIRASHQRRHLGPDSLSQPVCQLNSDLLIVHPGRLICYTSVHHRANAGTKEQSAARSGCITIKSTVRHVCVYYSHHNEAQSKRTITTIKITIKIKIKSNQNQNREWYHYREPKVLAAMEMRIGLKNRQIAGIGNKIRITRTLLVHTVYVHMVLHGASVQAFSGRRVGGSDQGQTI